MRVLILCDSVQACVQANKLSCATCTLQICTVQACLARNMSDACLSWCGRGSRVAARAWPRRAVSCAGFVHESPWSGSPLVKVRLAQRLRWVVGVSHDVSHKAAQGIGLAPFRVQLIAQNCMAS